MVYNDDENVSSAFSEYIKKYDLRKIHYDFVDRLMFIIATGLALIAALAWDDVIHTFFSKFFASLGEPLTQFGYAITLTILATLTAIIFRKISKKRRKKRLIS